MIERPIAMVDHDYVRHNPEHLARELILLHAERSVRIAGGSYGFKSVYRKER